jgi:hypothetical protein
MGKGQLRRLPLECNRDTTTLGNKRHLAQSISLRKIKRPKEARTQKKKTPPFLFTPKAGEAKKRTRGGRLQTLALGRSNVVRQPQAPDPRAPAFAIPLPSRGGNPALCCAARCARTGIHGIVGATRLVVVGPRWWRIRETRHGALPQVLLPQAARRAP